MGDLRRARCSRGWPRLGVGAGFGALFGLLACTAGAGEPAAAPSQIEGLDSWARAVTGRSSTKWAGQRVPFPAPSPRPASLGQLDAPFAPISVRLAAPAYAARMHEVLRSAETASALLSEAGLFEAHGDDMEFFAGGTIAKFSEAGHEITLVCATDNDKGSFELSAD